MTNVVFAEKTEYQEIGDSGRHIATVTLSSGDVLVLRDSEISALHETMISLLLARPDFKYSELKG